MNSILRALPWRQPRFEVLAARTVEEACAGLGRYGSRARAIAGGTDLLVALRRRKAEASLLVDLKTIPGLDAIREDGGALRLGALATLGEIERSALIRSRFAMIADSARRVGSPQIRNLATAGGNLCHGSPAADLAPALIALGGRAKVQGLGGEREIALEEFFLGPGVTALKEDEVLVEIQVPAPPPYTRGACLKLPARTAVDLALVGVAAVITLDSAGRRIEEAKIALGAVAPTPIRARAAEGVLQRQRLEKDLPERAARAASEEARPISDVRGSAAYRKEMVKVLTNRLLGELIGL